MKAFIRQHGLMLLGVAAVTACAYALGLFSHNFGIFGAPLLGMAISFNSIPSTLRLPFVAAEFDNSAASQGAAQLPFKALLIGQKTSAGTATANTLVQVTSADDVLTLAGRGSLLHRMAMAYFYEDDSTETWIGVVADNGAGVAASGTLTVTGPATATGTLSLYIGGTLVSVAVTSGDAQNTIASAINAAINAATDLPVTSGVTTNVVTVTAKNKGTCGNDIDMRLNYVSGEATPAGVAVAIVAMASGATNPVLTSLISAMGDTWFHIVGHPYTDATSLTALENEFSSRFGPMRMIDTVGVTSASGTFSTVAALGNTRNSQHNCIVSQPGKNPVTPAFEVAGAATSVKAKYASIDPAAPDQTLPLTWVQAPADVDLFTNTERNLLLFDGIGTTRTAAGGQVQLERMITTYKTNSSGASDTSYLDSTTMFTLQYLRFTFRNMVQAKYARFKLANDGTRFGAGQKVVTPKLMKAECYSWFRQMEDKGLVENFDAFKSNLVVERNSSDVNRLDVLLPPDIINQLIVTAASIQFRL